MSFPMISGDPTAVNDILPNAKAGGLYSTHNDVILTGSTTTPLTTKGTKVWRYVKIVGTSGDVAKGDCCVWADSIDGYSVTRISASALVGTPLGSVVPCAGVAQGTIETGKWGYILVRGEGLVKGDQSI